MSVQLAANTIRGLAMDAVQKAESGHPGAPMGLADFAAVLFLRHLKHNPTDPLWPDRDRFVLSAGHASTLLYSLLHLSGYDLSLDDLRNFRQWDSRTPGHPEQGLTPGVETTTGPLGQGCGNAVGMALAEAMLAARFNREGLPLVDHHTYAIASDGDLMEGVSHEAFSLAGHLKLHKLIVFYDSNRITIEGQTDLTCSDDVRKRFESYHWNVLEVDGHDERQLDDALTAARREKDRPTLIIGHTHIAKGSPHAQDTAASHGAPLGPDEVRATKRALGLPEDLPFHVPDQVRALFTARRDELRKDYDAWLEICGRYRAGHPDLADEWDTRQARTIPEDVAAKLPVFGTGKPIATRKASGQTLQALAELLPGLVGGSADLGPSNNTTLKKYPSVSPGACEGRNLHFGIREHAMGSILNGMTLHKGFVVYGGTFLVFADYFRPAIRLAALMRLPVIYVFTHDSIFLGEDGPTHQAIEHIASLRCVPNLTVIRPADANETAAAWAAALARADGPTALILTRQDVPVINRTECAPASLLSQGGYTLWQSDGDIPEIILIATGSEVAPTLEAGHQLAGDHVRVRVVSMPSWELFERQPQQVRDSVLPPRCICRLAVEAGCPAGWERYIGLRGRVLGIRRFGASAPHKILAEKFGFTPDQIARSARELLSTGD
ncbi:MAG: transketolase [Kiritimatiellae bacterium]|nr:transketolase [Kiritimatiellia bacterium]